jgi:hypothetical protein
VNDAVATASTYSPETLNTKGRGAGPGSSLRPRRAVARTCGSRKFRLRQDLRPKKAYRG